MLTTRQTSEYIHEYDPTEALSIVPARPCQWSLTDVELQDVPPVVGAFLRAARDAVRRAAHAASDTVAVEAALPGAGREAKLRALPANPMVANGSEP